MDALCSFFRTMMHHQGYTLWKKKDKLQWPTLRFGVLPNTSKGFTKWPVWSLITDTVRAQFIIPFIFFIFPFLPSLPSRQKISLSNLQLSLKSLKLSWPIQTHTLLDPCSQWIHHLLNLHTADPCFTCHLGPSSL